MFDIDELVTIYHSLSKKDKENNKKLVTKINRHGLLYINLNDLNRILTLTNSHMIYDITLLANYFKTNSIGYTSIIKKLKIPKATLSQMLNNGRNIKLETVNKFLRYYKIDKEILRKEI